MGASLSQFHVRSPLLIPSQGPRGLGGIITHTLQRLLRAYCVPTVCHILSAVLTVTLILTTAYEMNSGGEEGQDSGQTGEVEGRGFADMLDVGAERT